MGDSIFFVQSTPQRITVYLLLVESVHGRLFGWNMNKSAGPHEIHPAIINWLAGLIAGPFRKVFWPTMNQG